MSAPKILGREPAFIVGMVEAVLAVLVSFGMLSFIGIDGAEGVALVMAVVSGLAGTYVAYVTKDTLLGVGIALIKSILALVTYYGYDMTAEQIGTVLALSSLLLGSFQRTQTGPAILPSFALNQHSVEVPPEGEATDTTPVVTASGVVTEKPVPEAQDVPAPSGD